MDRVTVNVPKKKNRPFLYDTIVFAFFSLIIVIPIRLFVAQPFIVSGASMDPTFANGQYLIVDEISYRFNEPERGDTIVFKYPNDPSKYFIKRIIGLPKERVEIHGNSVYISNTEHPNGFKINEPYIAIENRREDEVVKNLGENEYFVMGDNRKVSADSRLWGPLPKKMIIGKPLIRLYPASTIEIFPGKTEITGVDIE